VIWRSVADGVAERNIRPDGEPAAVPTSGESSDRSFGRVDIEELLSGRDPGTLRMLIGQRVQLPLDMRGSATNVAFWIGPSRRELLVVIGRDTRSGAARQRSLPSRNPLGAVSDATQIMVSGVIDRVPNTDARLNWGLTRPETVRLLSRGAYLRIDSVESTGSEIPR
jgi:hypothetical protein